MLRIYTFCFLIVLSASAKANILLLNFNGNATTVSLATSYAHSNKQSVFVYPNKTVTEINRNTLPQILDEVNDKGITTVMFSGHSGHSFFSGKSGVLNRKDFMNAAKNYPQFQNSVTAVYARGCYSATKGDFFGNESWLQLFPNLNFVAGHEGKAWSSESSQSQSFVKDMLVLKRDFLKANNETDVLATYKKFESHTDTEAAVWIKQKHATFYVSTVQLQSGEPVINFIAVANSCESLKGKMQNIASEINRYFVGSEDNYKRPSTNTASGPVRQHYTWVLQNQHCRLLEAWDDDRAIRPQFIMSLLFYDKLVKNFSLNFNMFSHQQSLDWLEKVSGQHFVIPDIATASREEIRKFSMDVMSLVTNASAVDGLKDHINTYDFKILEYHAKAFHSIVSELQTSYIPERWLTEDQSFDQPMGLTMPMNTGNSGGLIFN